MTTLEKKIEAVRVANLIIKQLTDTTDANVFFFVCMSKLAENSCSDIDGWRGELEL